MYYLIVVWKFTDKKLNFVYKEKMKFKSHKQEKNFKKMECTNKLTFNFTSKMFTFIITI